MLIPPQKSAEYTELKDLLLSALPRTIVAWPQQEQDTETRATMFNETLSFLLTELSTLDPNGEFRDVFIAFARLRMIRWSCLSLKTRQQCLELSDAHRIVEYHSLDVIDLNALMVYFADFLRPLPPTGAEDPSLADAMWPMGSKAIGQMLLFTSAPAAIDAICEGDVLTAVWSYTEEVLAHSLSGSSNTPNGSGTASGSPIGGLINLLTAYIRTVADAAASTAAAPGTFAHPPVIPLERHLAYVTDSSGGTRASHLIYYTSFDIIVSTHLAGASVGPLHTALLDLAEHTSATFAPAWYYVLSYFVSEARSPELPGLADALHAPGGKSAYDAILERLTGGMTEAGFPTPRITVPGAIASVVDVET